MGQFDRQIATALRLIKKNGQAVKWRSIANSIPTDPDKPWIGSTNPAPVEHDVFICFVPVKDQQWRKFLKYLTNTEVQIGDLAGLMGNVNFEPNPKDVVIRDGVELAINNIDLLSPNGQKILWTLEFTG